MPAESTPLVAAPPNRNVAKTIACAFTLIAFSATLIQFNKWLLVDERFNHAMPLTMIHMSVCSMLSLMLLFVAPSLFPALTERDTPIDMDFLKSALPIAVVFASGLVLGNLAYSHLSVSFLQMIKESNLIWVYLLSLAVGLQVFAWTDLKIIVVALCGMCLSVHGELYFETAGFVIQFSALMCETTRVVLQGKMLSGKGRQLDPMSYVLLISPMCFVLLLMAFCITGLFPKELLGPGLTMPSWDTVMAWSPVLFLNGLVAFGLNVSIAVMIKFTSPTSYIFSQVVKDLLVVAVSVHFLHETCTKQQYLGFAVQTSMVLVWGLKNTFPEPFAAGIFPGFYGLSRYAWYSTDSANTLGFSKATSTAKSSGAATEDDAPENRRV